MSLRNYIEDIFNYYHIDISESGFKTILFLCPFHPKGVHSHNAVCYVKDGGWTCFNPGCDSGGSIITMVKRMEKCGKDRALEILKEKFSLDMSKLVFEEPDFYDKPKKYFPLPGFYVPISPKNSYIKDHEFTWSNLSRLQVGQMRDRPHTLVAAYIDQGRNVGYGVKPLGERMNFPRGFEVNDHLYASDLAVNYPTVYVVEGQRDAWRLWEHGLPTVGLNNAKCSGKQFNSLIKSWKHVILCLDGDKAGAIGMYKLFQRLQGLVKTEAIMMPYQKDPEDIRDKAEFLKLPKTQKLEVVMKYKDMIIEKQERDEAIAKQRLTE